MNWVKMKAHLFLNELQIEESSMTHNKYYWRESL